MDSSKFVVVLLLLVLAGLASRLKGGNPSGLMPMMRTIGHNRDRLVLIA